jgi:hypothetical protein
VRDNTGAAEEGEAHAIVPKALKHVIITASKKWHGIQIEKVVLNSRLFFIFLSQSTRSVHFQAFSCAKVPGEITFVEI